MAKTTRHGGASDVHPSVVRVAVSTPGAPMPSARTTRGESHTSPAERVSITRINYRGWTILRLQEALRRAGLPVSGSKAELIRRLEEREDAG